jgi:hypothetical protein
MSSENIDTLDPEEKMHVLSERLNESNYRLGAVEDSLDAAADDINGWEYSRKRTLGENVESMASVLIAAIKDRDARIQRLHIKLGQAAENQ